MKELFTALIAARKAMPDPRKSGKNPAFRSTFVPRDEALDSIVPTALAHGLLVSQSPVSDDHGYGVHTVLVHESGQSLDCGYFTVKPAKDDPQGAVAATTYASRCALMLVFAIAGDDDDDGNGVSKYANTAVARQDAPQATKAPKQVSSSAKRDSEAQKPANHSAEYNALSATIKAAIAKNDAEKVKAWVLNATKGKATADLTPTECALLESKMRHAYNLDD